VYSASQQNEDRKYVAPANTATPSGPLVQESGEGVYVLPIRELLQVMWRRAWVIALSAILLALVVVGYDLFTKTPEYEASTKILIGQKQGGDQSSLGSDAQGLKDVTITMAEAVKSRSVAEGVIERLGLSMTPAELLGHLNAAQVPDTLFIEVSYTDADPQRAQQVVSTVGDVFSERVSQVTTGTNSLTARVWDEAATSQDPVSPKPLRDAALALVLGAMLGVLLAFLLEHIDDRWRSPKEVEQVSGVPIFGIIPVFRPSKTKDGSRFGLRRIDSEEATDDDISRGPVVTADPSSEAAEAYRSLRTNLLYAVAGEPPRVVLVSSPGPMEGKSTTCANLAVMLAQAEKRALLMDCNLRQPALHKIFGLRNSRGVMDVLAGEPPEEVWQETSVPNLTLLSAGPVPPNPAELLSSRRFAELLDRVRSEFDFVVLDAPPVELVSDATILATQADATLLVLDARRTRKEILCQAVRNLHTVGASILGIVMNYSDSSVPRAPSMGSSGTGALSYVLRAVGLQPTTVLRK
jgi:polysaccharide biosynthesis transport protein